MGNETVGPDPKDLSLAILSLLNLEGVDQSMLQQLSGNELDVQTVSTFHSCLPLMISLHLCHFIFQYSILQCCQSPMSHLPASSLLLLYLTKCHHSQKKKSVLLLQLVVFLEKRDSCLSALIVNYLQKRICTCGERSTNSSMFCMFLLLQLCRR